jgi:uncharacterized protein (DUF427 family)
VGPAGDSERGRRSRSRVGLGLPPAARPRLEKSPKHMKVDFIGVTIIDTTNAYRVLETLHPPTYYLPPPGRQLKF